MEDLIKGELDWHNKVNENFHEVDSQMADIAYNVKQFGLKGDGETDDTDALQALINSIPNGSTIFFPVGTYLISKKIDISNKVINLLGKKLGSNNTFDGGSLIGSIILCADSYDNDFMIDFGNNDNMSSINNIVIMCKDGTELVKTNPTQFPAHSFYVNFTKNVSGITTSNKSFITNNCLFIGFGGTALKMGHYTSSINCRFTRCNKSIIADYDCNILNPIIHFGHTGIITNGGSIRITNPRIEEMMEYGIRVYNDLPIIIGGLIDRCEYSGIYGRGVDNNVVYGGFLVSGTVITRCGCYYGDTDKGNIPVSDYDKATNICIIGFQKINVDIKTQAGNYYDDNSGVVSPSINAYFAQITNGKINADNTIDYANCANVTFDSSALFSIINNSGKEILKFDKINNDIKSAIIGKTYRNLSDLNLSDSSSITDILNALPINSTLDCQAYNPGGWSPVQLTGYWVLRVYKGSDINYSTVTAINNTNNKQYRYNTVNSTWYTVSEAAI